MGWTAHTLTGEMGVTSEIKVECLNPVYLWRSIKMPCRLISRNDPKVHMEARIETHKGKVCTGATGIWNISRIGI